MLAFSHVSNVSGLALPAVELCRLAAERGVLTLVDGAQTFGMMNLNLREMGCDFFTGSAHKWLGGPHETGILYVRAERIDSLWPSMVTHDWESMAIDGARKFECLGQRQDGRIDALGIAVELHEMIGRARIERRIRFLADYLRIRLASTGKKIEFLTPANPAMSAGIVMFFIDVKNARGVMERLYGRHSISALALPVDGRTLVRFSPNIYNTLDELDLAAHAVAALA
jgi:selenocysteine lyase/cysteine desulfurase